MKMENEVISNKIFPDYFCSCKSGVQYNNCKFGTNCELGKNCTYINCTFNNGCSFDKESNFINCTFNQSAEEDEVYLMSPGCTYDGYGMINFLNRNPILTMKGEKYMKSSILRDRELFTFVDCEDGVVVTYKGKTCRLEEFSCENEEFNNYILPEIKSVWNDEHRGFLKEFIKNHYPYGF